MTQMFGSGVHHHVFIDRDSEGLLRYKRGSGPPTGPILGSLGGPPGPLVPGEVGPVGLDPGLGVPLLCDVVAPA